MGSLSHFMFCVETTNEIIKITDGLTFSRWEEMKEVMTETLDTFSLEVCKEDFRKWLECDRSINVIGSYFEGDWFCIVLK